MEISRFILVYVKLGKHNDQYTPDERQVSIWKKRILMDMMLLTISF